jgi:hypothetical protein
MALWSTQSLAEMSTRHILRVKGRPARKADNLTAICEPISRKCESLNFSQPNGPPRSVTGITLLYFYLLFYALLVSVLLVIIFSLVYIYRYARRSDTLLCSVLSVVWLHLRQKID